MISAPANPWKLGLFVVASGLLGLGALVYFAAATFDRRTFEAITLIDESVQGLDVGAPVKFRGVTIGKVTAIQFAPDRRHVAVMLQVYLDVIESLGLADERNPDPATLSFVDEGVRLQLSRSGITGITFLEADIFAPGDFPVPDHGFRTNVPLIPSVPSRLKGLEDGLTDALATLPSLLANTNALVVRVDRSLSAVDTAAVMARVERLLDGLTERVEAFDPAHLARFSVDLAGAAEDVRGLLVELRGEQGALVPTLRAATRAFDELDETLAGFDGVGSGAALRRAADGVARLADAGVLATETLQRDIAALREVLDAMRQLVELLERDPGVLLRGRAEEGGQGS